MSSYIKIESHDTPADLYAHLSRVFGEQEHNATRWTELTVDGVRIVFFAPRNDVVKATAA